MLQIAVINESTAISDAQVQSFLAAFQDQWNSDLSQFWTVPDSSFIFVPSGQTPPAAAWWAVFLDNSDQALALAYHDLTNEGLPLSKIFVKTIQADNSSLSVGATHELCEMAVDPWLNSAYQDQRGTFWAGEVCDPVEDDSYAYKKGDVLVTDFVTPNWFAHEHAQAQIDFTKHATASFQVLSGGYAQDYDQQKGWQQVTGSAASNSVKAKAPAGSRRERRARGARNWKPSLVKSFGRKTAVLSFAGST